MTQMLVRQGIALAGVLAIAAQAWAGTRTIDFDNLAVGTVVTTQYPGVTFSARPQSCGGSPPVNLVIRTPTGGTSSGAKGLGITTGCPDFSPDYIRIVFDQAQQEVTFTVGDLPGTYQVRAYTAAGGAAVAPQNVVVGGAGFVGVHRMVRVLSGSANIQRIEIDEVVGQFETIDDLTFACPDITPPDVQISSPEYEACACGNSVMIRGVACDEEGYDGDTLEYLAVNAAGGTAWTVAGSAGTAQCTPNGLLYSWNTVALAEGCYYVRITGRNDCGDSSSAVTVVCVDRTVDTPVVRSPADAAILGGTICVDGTVWDGPNAACLANYQVDYRPSGGADWSPVNPLTPIYASEVVNDPLASWATRTVLPQVTDGKWQLRVHATNTCGAGSVDVIRNVVIDNTPPVAEISEPLSCQAVEGLVAIRGTVSDAHLGNWVLQYTGGDAHGWVTIATGNAAVAGGLLGTWDTTALRRCAYGLRLVATDTAALDCIGSKHNQAEYMVTVYLGPVGRFDYDDDGDVDSTDFGVFQLCQSGPAIPAMLECLD